MATPSSSDVEFVQLKTQFTMYIKAFEESQLRRDRELEALWKRMDENARLNHVEYVKLDSKIDSNADKLNTKIDATTLTMNGKIDTLSQSMSDEMKGFRKLVITTLLGVISILVANLLPYIMPAL